MKNRMLLILLMIVLTSCALPRLQTSAPNSLTHPCKSHPSKPKACFHIHSTACLDTHRRSNH